jgi:hypothetical protein
MIYGALFVSGFVACIMILAVIGHQAMRPEHGVTQSAMFSHRN